MLVALSVAGSWPATRQRLREWYYDGADKAAPCHTQVEIRHCFASLLRWLRPVVPAGMTVLVLADCGLWSPRL